jgi:subfamily B ATP-binding cassette protein MsbA
VEEFSDQSSKVDNGSSSRPVIPQLMRLFRYLRPYWYKQTIALLFLLAGTGSSLVVPLLIKRLIDDALPSANQELLVSLVAAMIGLHMFYVVCIFITDYFFLRVSNAIVFDLRRDMHDRLIRLSMDYFERTKTGQLMARVMGDVDSVQALTTNAFLTLITEFFALLLMLGFMCYLSWQLTLLGTGTILVLIFTNKIFNQHLLKSSRASRQKYAHISEDMQETIAGMREIKIFTHEELKHQSFTHRLRSYYGAKFRMGLWGSAASQLSMLIVFLGPVIVYYYGGLGVIRGTVTIGLLVAFIVYLNRMYNSAMVLTSLNIMAQSSMGAVERIFGLLDQRTSIIESSEPLPMPETRGEIELKEVSFRYGKAEGPYVLQGTDIDIAPGEKVALVGASGIGKTSVVNLICRFYDPEKGIVSLDGKDVRKIKIEDLRKEIGIVPQDTFLFHASIEDNLKIGNPNASREEIEKAACLANADEFISNLPDGYQTIVGERGVKLSGGQRQRLAITRVILKDPRIVIFDEATSSLDTKSERLVKESMNELMSGRTTLIVSHRLSSVADADRIMVLDNGKIAEEGTHHSLMERNGLYRQLYELQTDDRDTLRLESKRSTT